MAVKFVGELKSVERKKIEVEVEKFIVQFEPLEKEAPIVFLDECTGAAFFEAHIRADRLLNNSTLDVPLDPENQGEYRANRDVVEDAAAFVRMKADAGSKRTFSNIVAEYSEAYDNKHPLKIIGGQHRCHAIREAFEKGVNVYHGIKVYFCLSAPQRLDVQLISNTNIAVSGDLLDRMYETVKGPELRNWCQSVGLLEPEEDFADKKERGGNITVRGARSFVLSYFEGRNYDSADYAKLNPEPILAKTGGIDENWEKFRAEKPEFWKDAGLAEAGKAFAELNEKQYAAVKKKTGSLEYAEKALSYPVLTAWAYIAGLLYKNKPRLKRHYELSQKTSTDPLNTTALAQGRHKTDSANYRGLGVRTDMKDRGRLAELFFLQAENGAGIAAPLIDIAIKKYHAKLAALDVEEATMKYSVR